MRISNISLPNTGLVLAIGDAGSGKSSRVANALLLEAASSGRMVRVFDVGDLNLAGNNPDGFNMLELVAASENALIVVLADTLAHVPASFKTFLQENCHAVFVLHCSSPETRNWVRGYPYRKWGVVPARIADPITFPFAGSGKSAVAAAFVRTVTGTSAHLERRWDVARMCSLPLVNDDQVAPALEPDSVFSWL